MKKVVKWDFADREAMFKNTFLCLGLFWKFCLGDSNMAGEQDPVWQAGIPTVHKRSVNRSALQIYAWNLNEIISRTRLDYKCALFYHLAQN